MWISTNYRAVVAAGPTTVLIGTDGQLIVAKPRNRECSLHELPKRRLLTSRSHGAKSKLLLNLFDPSIDLGTLVPAVFHTRHTVSTKTNIPDATWYMLRSGCKACLPVFMGGKELHPDQAQSQSHALAILVLHRCTVTVTTHRCLLSRCWCQTCTRQAPTTTRSATLPNPKGPATSSSS